MMCFGLVGLVFTFVSIINAQRIDLGAALPFAVLAGSTATNTGLSAFTFHVGVYPGEAITGFDLEQIAGETHLGDTVAQQAQLDVVTAYNDAALRYSTPLEGDLGGTKRVAGVYSFTTSAVLTGTLTLDGKGDPNSVWIFQIGSTLTTAGASIVKLTNGALACNVFWQVGSSATLGSSTSFVGNILALTSITVGPGATNNGGLYARNGAVTLENNIIDHGPCLAAPSGAPSSASSTVASSVVSSIASISTSHRVSSAISSQAPSAGTTLTSSALFSSSPISSTTPSSTPVSISESSATSSEASTVASSSATSSAGSSTESSPLLPSSIASSTIASSTIASSTIASSTIASSTIASSTIASSSIASSSIASSSIASSSITSSGIPSSIVSSSAAFEISSTISSTGSYTTLQSSSMWSNSSTSASGYSTYSTRNATSSRISSTTCTTSTTSSTTCTTSSSTKSYEEYVPNTQPQYTAVTTTSSCTTFRNVRPSSYIQTADHVSPPAGYETEGSSPSSTLTVTAITTGVPTPQTDQDEAYHPNESSDEGHDSYIPSDQPNQGQPQVYGTGKNTTSSPNVQVVAAGAAVVSMRWFGGATVAFLVAVL